MSYRVIISDDVFVSVGKYLDFIAVEHAAPQSAERWWERAYKAVKSLDQMPHRAPIAPESEFSEHTIRMLIVDNGLFLYRVDEKAKAVRVVGFRHGRQKPIIDETIQ